MEPVEFHESRQFDLRRVRSLSSLDLKVSKLSLETFSHHSGSVISSATLSSARSSVASESPLIDLHELALPSGAGFGYKSANLIKLRDLALRLGVKVPDILTLSHHLLMGHILRSYPEFSADYARFLDLLGNPPDLNREAKDCLDEIQDRVKSAFLGENVFAEGVLREWLSGCSSEFIAVRSTGKEDSDTNSNAGGNLSNPFVSNNYVQISKNIGEVIASYFSEKSISQRIASRDPSLLTDREPFVPVLLQESVAESLQGITDEYFIPRSGVMFVKSDFSEVCVGYGHNEGVVSSEVRTDCYRFGASGGIQSVIQNKMTRFRASRELDGSVSCGPTRMQSDMARVPALREEIAKRMQVLARELYEHYGKEMDVEFTIIGDEIFLLQARPLNSSNERVEPSYLIESEDLIECESLTTGGCYVRSIEREEEVIVCKTIKDAYASYKEKRGLVKAIVIEETAPRTSHEAVFFTGLGIPVLVSGEKFELRPPYFLDPQQGIIAKRGRVEPGYICYPIPLQYSMKASSLVEEMHRQSFEPEIGRKLTIERGLKELQDRIGPPLGRRIKGLSELKDCLYRVKSANPEEVRIALSQIVYGVADQAFVKDMTAKNRIELIMVLENLLDVVEGDFFSSEPMSMTRLYGARLVEACLFQTGFGIIGGSSYKRVLTDIFNERRGISELTGVKTRDLPLYVQERAVNDVLFIKVGRQLLKSELKESWRSVITHLPYVSEGRKNVIKSLFLLLDKIGDSTEFINVTIAKLLSENSEESEKFFGELEALSLDLKPTLQKALEIKSFADDMKANVGAFSNSKNIRKGLSRIIQRIQKIGLVLGPGSIINAFRSASCEKRLILIQALREVVTSYDHLIKACSGSTEYTSNIARANDFLALLRPYKEMMIVIKQLSGVEVIESFNQENYELPDTLEGISEEEAEALKETSPGFDVKKIIASESVIYTLEPPPLASTLEEKFTLFHQTMEHHLSMMAVANGFSVEMLPLELQTYIRGIADREFLPGKQLTLIKMEGDLIKVNFSVPLRDHAAKLSFSYNQSSRTVDVQLSIFGGNEWGRWGEIERLAIEGGKHLGIDVRIGKKSDTECNLKMKNLELDGPRGAQVVSKFLGGLLENSFTGMIDVLQLIPEEMHTIELARERVSSNAYYLQFVSRHVINPELIELALNQNVFAFEFVPEEMQTPEMVLRVVSENPDLLECVRPDLISDHVIYESLRLSPQALKHVPLEKQTEAMVFDVVQRDGLALKFVRPDLKSKAVVDAALLKSIDAFAYMPEEMQTKELAMKAVKNTGELLGRVRQDLISKALVEAAFSESKGAIRFVPHHLQTPKMVLAAVSYNGRMLRYVHPSLMSREVIQAALERDPDAFEFIPIELRIPEMLAPAIERGVVAKFFGAIGSIFSRLKP